jgi:nucleotide-binding universal stress UspA family protein
MYGRILVPVDGSSCSVKGLTEAAARQWRADLIVMGTHGRRGMSRLAMGSDAELVVRSTPVPVLLVRERTDI